MNKNLQFYMIWLLIKSNAMWGGAVFYGESKPKHVLLEKRTALSYFLENTSYHQFYIIIHVQ